MPLSCPTCSLDGKSSAALLCATALVVTQVALLGHRQLHLKAHSEAAVPQKLYHKPAELGVQHFTVPGEHMFVCPVLKRRGTDFVNSL